MNAIEELLDQSIKPTSASVDSDWAVVVSDSHARRERRTALSRVAVVGVVAIFLLLQVTFADSFDPDVVTSPPTGQTLPEVDGELSLFPTSTDIFAQAGEAPLGPVLAIWLLGLLPLVAAWAMWKRSLMAGWPERALSTRSRLLRATGAALATAVLLSAGLGVALLFLYDPLGAATGTSLLVVAAQTMGVVVPWVAVGCALVYARQLDDSKSERVATGIAVYFVWAATSAISGVLTNGLLGWTQTRSETPPGRGLWQLFVPGDSVYLVDGAPISLRAAWFGLALALVGGALLLRWARTLMTTPPDDFPSVRPEHNGPSIQRFSAGVFLLFGVLLLVATVVNEDVSARQSLHVVSLPTEVTDAGEVSVRRTINRSILDENALFEIVIEGEVGQFADVTNADLLGASLFEVRTTEEGATLVQFGRGPTGLWEITRDDLDSSITLRAWETVSFPGLNTTIFVSAMLFLAATSRRLRGLADDQILGRTAASWFAIAAAAVIGLRMVVSLFVLEADAGTLEERGGLSLFDVYTAGLNGPTLPPVSLYEISGWFFIFWFAIPIPLFGLATIGLRRLGISAERAVAATAVLLTVILGVRFGSLLTDWVDWILD